MSPDGFLPRFRRYTKSSKTPWNQICYFVCSPVCGIRTLRMSWAKWPTLNSFRFVLVCKRYCLWCVKPNPDAPHLQNTLGAVCSDPGVISCFPDDGISPIKHLIRLLAWMALGFIIYFGYPENLRRNSSPFISFPLILILIQEFGEHFLF